MRGRPRVKICGIRSLVDAELAIKAGAQAIAFNFVPTSKRYIHPEKAREIIQVLPPYISVAGVFADEPRYSVEEIVSFCRLEVLQFHGHEDPEYCRRWSYRIIKAFRLRAEGATTVSVGALASWEELLREAGRYAEVCAFLLDTDVPGLGGAGRTFDWSLVQGDLPKPVIVGGGLTPDNVGAAIMALRPYAVDVASGVETNGQKDGAKMRAFVQAVDVAGELDDEDELDDASEW
ncbi:phosphoribosylanthranilate isomerase [Heliophilum fasciatum]|uniref:N-(5'-phosphoribosyl)anthranilate isomerase n=1 Tax=Heliophilum fasciatum TaxID=35700 RepID=A0A4V2SWW1_9FIRM|nr:phosphoribosylanthranilate isomerase [Heliophilum fasciatum]MCW2278310.1 phosphoribosylanthranilate isomerase [Heliophilum fasciatum]TCP63816.1 phosphoribosylanthranilate isomerase [Heliophilum fasciatum]